MSTIVCVMFHVFVWLVVVLCVTYSLIHMYSCCLLYRLSIFRTPSVFNIKTIEDLAHWKYFKIARALVALKSTEQKGKRDVSSKANVNKALDKEYEKKSLAVTTIREQTQIVVMHRMQGMLSLVVMMT